MACHPTAHYHEVIRAANTLPQEYKHTSLEPCHVTLAILRHGVESGNTGYNVVNQITYGNAQGVQAELEKRIEIHKSHSEGITQINRVMQTAWEYSCSLLNDFTGTEHLLYAAVKTDLENRGPSIAVLEMAGPGINLEGLDRWISIIMARQGKPVCGFVDKAAEAAAQAAQAS